MDALDEISIGQGADASWFELRFSSLQDGRGQFLGRVVVMRDITARKNTEKALSTALEQAQEASRLKSQLLARVSHELRTPLGSILGFAELLNMNSFGVLDNSQKEATAQIIESSNYLDRIINELLDQAELDSNALILQNVTFYLRDVIQKVKEEMSDFASAKGLDFHVNLASDFPKAIYGDQQRIRQILAILVHNAIKFTSEGRVDLHIQRFGANYWEIKVSDTGPGIPEEAQSYIFESFRQVNPMITSENRGAGLGLSIARQLTELMKGEIRLESKPGRGSTFIVTLPLMEQTA
jgi:two-component system sensor histidine kinase/response regulator